MASLVAPLACGVVGAVSGSATFFNEGTGTPATVYSDPEGVTVVTSHVLDANGGIVRYVNNRVDVVVKNAAAATVRTFTWGTDARECRVENAGFTGTLAGGGTAPGGRSTVDAVFTALFASLGAVDGKVLVNGVGVNLSAALAGISGLVFSVKSYGALGNGTTDDRAAIIATIAAAISAGGGIIFFPDGTYKILGQITIPSGAKVCLLGASESGVTIVQHTTATNGWFLIGTDSMSIMNMTFSRNAAAMTGRVLQTQGKVNVIGCTFAGWGGSHLYFSTDDTAEFNCVGCTFTQNESTSRVGLGDCIESRMRFNDCTFVVTADTVTVFEGLSGIGDFHVYFQGCYMRLTGVDTTVVSASVNAYYSACTIKGNGASGTYSLGAGDFTFITGSFIVAAPGSSVYLGTNFFESANKVNGTLVDGGGGGVVYQSAKRERRVLNTTTAGPSDSYAPSIWVKNHCLTYPGTNVGTLTISAPTPVAYNNGDRIELNIYQSGASGPSALSWNGVYSSTPTGGGPALAATIAMGTVLTFAFTYNSTANKWVLSP